MQMKKATELREQWGNKPCDHPSLEKEYELGSATGDYVCTQCGKAGWGSDWARKEREGKKR
ncbi:MAG: hypothetical protein GY941_00285 [Planctomycetes bacterium]|nr:hypothetical protein [Planctomycetota bacterium]